MPSALTLLVAAWLLAISRVGSNDPVPDLCNLIDQPMYCRCDARDADEVTDVTCYVGRKLPDDHVVFRSFERQPSVTSVAFTAFGSDYKLDFVPTLALLHTPHVERLKVSQAELGDVKPHSFHNLSRLAVLSLDSNEITSLDAESIADIPRLKKLELGDNKLRRLRAGSLKNLPSLTHLFLERNQLEVVDDGAFEDLGALRELELSDNAIEKLSEQSFRGLGRVARLDLFRNKLTRLEARVFGGMPQLAELDLKYNALSEVDPLAFEGLPQLTVLYMSYNRLRVLPAHMFRGAPNLVSVDLSQNQLLTLTWRTVQDLAKIDAESFDMSLTGNKFSCDCRLAWILHLERATRHAKFRRELRHVKCDFDDATAANATGGSKVVRLSLKQLGCAEDYERPELGDRPLSTDTPESVLPSAHPYDNDYEDVSDDEADGDESDENSRNFSLYDRQHSREEMPSVTKEVDVILSQQKALEKDTTVSSNGHKGAHGTAAETVPCEAMTVRIFILLFSVCAQNFCR
ncbi:connectin-like [Dermacentor albipictus]|uniref:connectin-like n=1 Tax=Dermacentor albipictus TaxID=60249 RepID=UPI0031FDBD66